MSKRAGFLRSESGQSMVELALALPLLLLILVGVVEIGMYYNTYLTLVDGTRESARFLADLDYLNVDLSGNTNCNTNTPPTTTDFFIQGACEVLNNSYGIKFDYTTDDIVVSAVTVKDGNIVARYPNDGNSVHSNGGNPANGWSYCRNIIKTGCVPAASLFDNAALNARISSFTGTSAPDTGLVVIEVYHLHRQFLGLIPPGLAFLPQAVMIHAYTIMPLPSAAPPPGG